jgi:hypothetical protein
LTKAALLDDHMSEADCRGAASDVEGRAEKRRKDLASSRTSCSQFWANQFRVLLTAAAYVLMQELRLRATGTACPRAIASIAAYSR